MHEREFKPATGFKGQLARQAAEMHDEEKKRIGRSAVTAAAGQTSSGALLDLQQNVGNRYVQRLVSVARQSAAPEAGPDVENLIQHKRGGGQSLDSGVRRQMESSFQADFTNVRVHHDTEADTLNRAVSARAFTTGHDIFFSRGAYSPGSSAGKELLAHELTHVVQQNPDKVQTKANDENGQSTCTCGGAAAGPQMKLSVSEPGDAYEQEADKMASAVMQSERSAAAPSQTQSLHRQPEEEKDKLQGKYHDDLISRQMEEEKKEHHP